MLTTMNLTFQMAVSFASQIPLRHPLIKFWFFRIGTMFCRCDGTIQKFTTFVWCSVVFIKRHFHSNQVLKLLRIERSHHECSECWEWVGNSRHAYSASGNCISRLNVVLYTYEQMMFICGVCGNIFSHAKFNNTKSSCVVDSAFAYGICGIPMPKYCSNENVWWKLCHSVLCALIHKFVVNTMRLYGEFVATIALIVLE